VNTPHHGRASPSSQQAGRGVDARDGDRDRHPRKPNARTGDPRHDARATDRSGAAPHGDAGPGQKGRGAAGPVDRGAADRGGADRGGPDRGGSDRGPWRGSRGAQPSGRSYEGSSSGPSGDRRGDAAAPRRAHAAQAERSHPPSRSGAAEPRGASTPLYAALDLGTNNCRLLIAEPVHRSFRVVDAFSRIVRLGEGVSMTGRLSDAAMDRAVEALRICRAKLDARGVERARLVATEACRIAENGADFLERVVEETGLKLEVLSRETEARLAVAGCASLVDWDADGVVLFDIGGGSSELVWLDFAEARRGGDPTRHIRAWTSLPLGVVTLSERHGGVSVDPAVFEAMVDDVESHLAALADWEPLAAAIAGGEYHMLGTSGTVTTLAGVHLGLKRYDRRRVDGTWLHDDEVGEMIDLLLGMSFDDRVANPCIGADRADLVLAGCAILEAIRRRWRCERLRVADRGLREGILTELMIADGRIRR
jgi:exopolyphosphatase/guanosine-5'-triphosphate,3'-diphosphate pyrophosphatase